jgi:formylmethanofuran dehydrogenase subunit E
MSNVTDFCDKCGKECLEKSFRSIGNEIYCEDCFEVESSDDDN